MRKHRIVTSVGHHEYKQLSNNQDCVGEQQPSYADQKWLPEKGVRRVHVKKVSLCFSKFLEEKLLKTAAK